MTVYTATANGQTFDLTGADDTVVLGNFHNITVLGANAPDATIGAGNGDDAFTVTTGDSLSASDGDDHVTVAASSNNVMVSLGNGRDIIASSGGLLGSTLIAGNRNDTVTDLSGDGNAILLGNGTNTVTLSILDVLEAGLGSATESDIVTLNAVNVVYLGDGSNTLLGAAVSDTVYLGNGNNYVTLSPESSNDLISLGNGDDTVVGTHSYSNVTILAGTGDDLFRLEKASGNFTLSQATGAGVDTIDLTSATLGSVDLTIGNRADVIETGDDTIAHFTINVAVDGFKLPDGDAATQGYTTAPTANVVNYVDTNEVINPAYAQAVPLPYFIAELLFSPTPHWNNELGEPVTLDFSFMQSQAAYQADDTTGFAPLGGNVPAGLTPSELLADNSTHLDGVSLSTGESIALTAMAAWVSVANVTYISETDSPDVPVRIGSNDQGEESGGYSYVPFPDTTGDAYLEEGDVYVNNDTAVEPVSDWGRVFIHEFGHVLGLGGESGDSDTYDILPGGTRDEGGGEDSALYTVMSYDNPPAGFANAVTAPQIFDIGVAQYLYGANPTFDANPSHVWTFSSTPYRPNSDAAQNTSNLIDGAGGTADLIAAGSWSGVGYIDLRPGHWSWLGAQSTNILAADQLFIDYGTVVDGIDAHLTSGSMTLVGNDGDDAIVCGTGNDLVVVAGSGTDSIAGGIGSDTILFQAAEADYTIAPDGDDVFTVTADAPADGGTVILSNVANLAFTDQTIADFAPIDLGDLNAAQFAAIAATQFGALSASVVATMSVTEAEALTSTQLTALNAPQLEILSSTVLNALVASGIAAFASAQIPFLTTSQIASLGTPALGALTTSEIAALTESQIGALSTTQFDQLTATQFANLAPASLGLLAATTLASLSAARIGELTKTQLANMRIAALAELTQAEVAELTTAQLAGLNAAAIHAFGVTDLDAMTATQLAALTASQIAGFDAAAIAGLAQANIAVLGTSVIAALSRTQVNALTATELGALTATQLGGLSTGDMAILSTTQLAGLAAAQFGAFTTTQIGALATTGIAALSQAQIYGLSTQGVAALTTAQVKALTPNELLGLSANQFAAFTGTQLSAMSGAQYAAILG